MNYATERVSERCQIKAKRQQRAKQGTTIEPLRGIFRTCLNSLALKCHLFSVNFNIVSALFIHQLLCLPQKNDSREGLFRCKMGLVVHAGKMNIYFKEPPIALGFGLFAAKCSAIWYKTQCILVLNAMRFGAKCNAFWC